MLPLSNIVSTITCATTNVIINNNNNNNKDGKDGKDQTPVIVKVLCIGMIVTALGVVIWACT